LAPDLQSFAVVPLQLYALFALWIVLALVPLLWALRAHSPMCRDERVFRLTFVVSPLLLGALWLHGVLFDAPSDWTAASSLAAWLRPHAPEFYRAHASQLIAIAAPGVALAAVLAYRGARSLDFAWNRRTAAISYALQISAWLLLQRLAAALVDLTSIVDWPTHTRELASHALPLALAILIPLPIATLAFMFARQALERRRPRPA
jgi:hypothetical protein